jgi:hypothetical protein
MWHIGLLISAGVSLQASDTPDAREMLCQVEQARASIATGVLELRYEDSFAGLPGHETEVAAYFEGSRRYAMTYRVHTDSGNNPSALQGPYCVQIFDGSMVRGMIQSVQVQRYFACDERGARLQFFNPYWLGITAFPIPDTDPDELFFWRKAAEVTYLGVDGANPDACVLRVATSPATRPARVADVTVDMKRGYNIIKYRAPMENGYTLTVESELGFFDGIWFPCHIVMTQETPRGTVNQALVDVIDARFNVDLPADSFSWRPLGRPQRLARALIVDERPGGGAYGWWDGRTFTPSRQQTLQSPPVDE